MTEKTPTTDSSAAIQLLQGRQQADRQGQIAKDDREEPSRFYRARLGRETITLDEVEYRILELLTSRPYYAFTRRRIVEAVTTERHPVTEQTLGRHIASLREKLGFFSDYIQTVPFIGYRFKE